jgi:hypothetical protein
MLLLLVAAGADSCVKIPRNRCYEHLDAMRSLCQTTRPEVFYKFCNFIPSIVLLARKGGQYIDYTQIWKLADILKTTS